MPGALIRQGVGLAGFEDFDAFSEAFADSEAASLDDLAAASELFELSSADSEAALESGSSGDSDEGGVDGFGGLIATLTFTVPPWSKSSPPLEVGS